MALVLDDFYLILSDGMYAGSVSETTITATQRYSRILSHGLLSSFPAAIAAAFAMALNIGRPGISLEDDIRI